MQNLRTVPSLFLAAGLALAATPVETALRERDQQDLGESLTGYFKARFTLEGLSDAEELLEKAIAKIEKKLDVEGGVLACPEDLGRAMWLSQNYADQKGAKKGKVTTFQATSPWEVEYALHAPKRYSAKEALPLFLILADQGQDPGQVLADQWQAEELREAAILAVVPMPTDQKLWAERGTPDAPGGGGNLRIVYRQVKDLYAIDFDRVFLVGSGAGANAALHIASESPDFFAGVIARSAEVDETLASANFKNLPLLLADADESVQAFAKKVDEAGGKTSTIDDGESAIWAWANELRRTSFPTEIAFQSLKPYVNKAYWIEFPPSDGVVEVNVTADREANTVTIRAKGVESVTLLLNDRIVDMTKPIKVTCNGAAHEDLVPRNLRTTLELMWMWRSDPGKVFVARKIYDAPSETK